MKNSVAEFFIRYGVALLWPGDSGPWVPHYYKDNYALESWVEWFAQSMSDGDAILLRTGPSCIRAVGLVVGEYSYEDRFDDVHGFDLQHCRRVRWSKLPQDYDFGESVFTQGRFSRVRSETVCQYVSDFLHSPPTRWQTAALPELPAEEPPLAEVPPVLQGLVASVTDLVPLFINAQAFGEPPSEDEMITHFVVPLLRALGWPPERIAVKWRYVDVAVFRSLPRTPEHCQLVIEAKRLGAGVEEALVQAKGYVKALGRPIDVILTDGIRYRMYACLPAATGAEPEDQSYFNPIAYANLARLKRPAAELFARMKRP